MSSPAHQPGHAAGRPRRRSRLRTVALSIGAGIAALALALVGLAGLTGAHRDHDADRAGSATTPSAASTAPAPSSSPSSGAPATPPDVGALLQGFAAAGADAAADPTTGTDRVDSVVTGRLLDEVANDQKELAAFGWSRTGRATIVSSSVLSSDLTATPARVTVRACVDTAAVVTLDSDGKPLAADPTFVPRSLTDFTLIDSGGVWLIADRTYPDNPQC